MSFLKKKKKNTVLSLGFCWVCTVPKQCIVCFDPQCLLKLWANMKGKPVGAALAPVCRRFNVSQWEGHLCHLSDQSPTFTISSHTDPDLESENCGTLWICTFCLHTGQLIDQTRVNSWPDFKWKDLTWFHYVACAWTWWREKKNLTKKNKQKKCFWKILFCCCFLFCWDVLEFQITFMLCVFAYSSEWCHRNV